MLVVFTMRQALCLAFHIHHSFIYSFNNFSMSTYIVSSRVPGAKCTIVTKTQLLFSGGLFSRNLIFKVVPRDTVSMSFMEEGTGMQSAHVICPVFLIAHGEFAGILVNLTLTT